jgi:hypothetical protein
MTGPDGKPTKPDNDFEPLVPALEKRLGKKFARLPAKHRKWITGDRRAAMLALLWDGTTPGRQRTMAEQRDWDANPANKAEAEFYFEVPFRKTNLEAMKVQAQNADAPEAVALAMRNAMLFHIDEAISSLATDEDEVRTAPPGGLKARIERVRKRWKESDRLIAAPGTSSERPVAIDDPGTSHDSAHAPSDEVRAWYKVWLRDHPGASDAEVKVALAGKFKEERFTRRMILHLVNPDKAPRRSGKKSGKTNKEHDPRMRQTANSPE